MSVRYEKLKIVLVHDSLRYYGGAERVLQAFHKKFPNAPICTLTYSKQFAKKYFPKAIIRATILQKFPFTFQWTLPFLPSAIESINIKGADLVISSGIFAKGIVTRAATKHIHYCHTPPRFLWEESNTYPKEHTPWAARALLKPTLHWLRLWDRLAALRPDRFIANSLWTKHRIKKLYGQEAVLVYPPVLQEQLSRSSRKKQGDYYLIVSRLQKYKNIELAIQVWNKLRLPLIIVGIGPDKKRLKRIAGKHIRFLGFKTEEKLQFLYAHARALIVPGVEDFGLTMAEAMNQGTPVLALYAGGAKEIVTPGKTGEFFYEQTKKSLYQGLLRLQKNEPYYKRYLIRRQANKYSFNRFSRRIDQEITRLFQ